MLASTSLLEVVRVLGQRSRTIIKRRLHVDSPEYDSAIKRRMWQILRSESLEIIAREPSIAPLIDEAVLQHNSFKDALIYRLATKLSGSILPPPFWVDVMEGALQQSLNLPNTRHKVDLERLAMEDLIAVEERDPACSSIAQAFLYFKGYKAIQSSRFSHVLWKSGRQDVALVMQGRISEVFGVDIHPNASIGGGLMLDHATGVVIGETAVLGRNCSMLHGVTLGATGRHGGERHPKIGNNCYIGCHTTILGNIEVGSHSKIGASSMVLKPLEAGSVAVGNPLRVLSVNTLALNEQEEHERLFLEEANRGDASEKLQEGVVTWTKLWKPKLRTSWL